MRFCLSVDKPARWGSARAGLDDSGPICGWMAQQVIDHIWVRFPRTGKMLFFMSFFLFFLKLWWWWFVAPLSPKLQTALARFLDELERNQKKENHLNTISKMMGTLVQVQLYTFSYRKALFRPQIMPKIADWGVKTAKIAKSKNMLGPKRQHF